MTLRRVMLKKSKRLGILYEIGNANKAIGLSAITLGTCEQVPAMRQSHFKSSSLNNFTPTHFCRQRVQQQTP